MTKVNLMSYRARRVTARANALRVLSSARGRAAVRAYLQAVR